MSLEKEKKRLLFRLVLSGATFAVAFAAWLALAELDVSSNAIGTVIPAGRVKTVQHLEGGIVRKIHITEGQRVVREQVLITLDPVRASSDFDEISDRLLSLEVEIARLTAESAGEAALVMAPSLEERAKALVRTAKDMFEIRRRHLHHETEALRKVLLQREQEKKEIDLRIENSRKTLAIVTAQSAISEKLLDKELTSKLLHLDLKRQEQTLRSQMQADEAAHPRIAAAIAEANERLAALQDNFSEQVHKDLTTALQSRDELASRVAKFRNAEERTRLKSPVDGIVKSVAVTTEGAVVQPGATIVEIVPMEEGVLIEARLPVHEVGFVHAGQEVRITLDSPDAALFPPIHGVVDFIGPDALMPSDDKSPYYRVKIFANEQRFAAHGVTYDLYPGVRLVCAIRIGRRPLYRYLLGSWMGSARFALEER